MISGHATMTELSCHFVHRSRFGRFVGRGLGINGGFDAPPPGVTPGVQPPPPGTTFAGPTPDTSPCPGFTSFRVNGVCFDPLAAVPGGAPMISPTTETTAAGGVAVMGAFGMPALTPMLVGVIMDHHGVAQPIRRCIPGMVLGKDNLCYEGSSLTRSTRKWPKDKRPPVSVSDAECIRKASAAKGRVKKLAKGVGFKVTG